MADVIVARAEAQTGFAPHPEGQFALQCVDVIDLGERVEAFQQNAPKLVHKAVLLFRSAELNDEGQYFEVSKEFTASMGEKANLRKFLGSWRGKSYTDEQAQEGAPLHKLEGVFALASVEHKQSKTSDRVYANIAAIGPLPKEMPRPNTGKYERQEYWAKKKGEYAETAAKFRKDAGAPPLDDPPDSLNDPDDDLPF